MINEDKTNVPKAAQEYGESFKTGEWFENLRIEAYTAGANWMKEKHEKELAELDNISNEFKHMMRRRDYWKERAEKTEAERDKLQKIIDKEHSDKYYRIEYEKLKADNERLQKEVDRLTYKLENGIEPPTYESQR